MKEVSGKWRELLKHNFDEGEDIPKLEDKTITQQISFGSNKSLSQKQFCWKEKFRIEKNAVGGIKLNLKMPHNNLNDTKFGTMREDHILQSRNSNKNKWCGSKRRSMIQVSVLKRIERKTEAKPTQKKREIKELNLRENKKVKSKWKVQFEELKLKKTVTKEDSIGSDFSGDELNFDSGFVLMMKKSKSCFNPPIFTLWPNAPENTNKFLFEWRIRDQSLQNNDPNIEESREENSSSNDFSPETWESMWGNKL